MSKKRRRPEKKPRGPSDPKPPGPGETPKPTKSPTRGYPPTRHSPENDPNNPFVPGPRANVRWNDATLIRFAAVSRPARLRAVVPDPELDKLVADIRERLREGAVYEVANQARIRFSGSTNRALLQVRTLGTKDSLQAATNEWKWRRMAINLSNLLEVRVVVSHSRRTKAKLAGRRAATEAGHLVADLLRAAQRTRDGDE